MYIPTQPFPCALPHNHTCDASLVLEYNDVWLTLGAKDGCVGSEDDDREDIKGEAVGDGVVGSMDVENEALDRDTVGVKGVRIGDGVGVGDGVTVGVEGVRVGDGVGVGDGVTAGVRGVGFGSSKGDDCTQSTSSAFMTLGR